MWRRPALGGDVVGMTRDEIIEFVRANPVGWVATVEDDRPHVRALRAFRVNDDGPLFQITEVKDVYRQLAANANVEACFNDQERGIQVRVGGKARFVRDEALFDDVLAERSFLQPLVEKHGREVIKLFVIANAVAHVWTRELNFEPKEYVEL
jgi:pyridoxamine 5'-phosphate oxidase